ncbi:MAG: rhodanese-like domain-containing protein [Candidatus Binatia bacterium]
MAKQQTLATAHEFATISRDELIARLQDHALAIVDVMPRETFADGHIPGSINLPVAEVEARAREMLSNFAQEIAVYCAGPS